jgi:hypothetical protein
MRREWIWIMRHRAAGFVHGGRGDGHACMQTCCKIAPAPLLVLFLLPLSHTRTHTCTCMQAYDQHLNMILGDVEEVITTVEIDDETYEEIIKVGGRFLCCSLPACFHPRGAGLALHGAGQG